MALELMRFITEDSCRKAGCAGADGCHHASELLCPAALDDELSVVTTTGRKTWTT